MPSDLPFHSLTSLKAHLERGDVRRSRSSKPASRASTRSTPSLHAFVDVYRDEALAARSAADLERAAGLPRGPLHGLPIALKDLLHIEGRQTTAGSKTWLGRISATHGDRGRAPARRRHDPARQDAHGRVRVRRLGPQRADGRAVESVGHGDASRRRRLVAAAPRSPSRPGSRPRRSAPTPAARCASPPSLCGLTGLKPTYGLISLHGAVPLSTTLDSIGPLDAHASTTRRCSPPRWPGADPRDPATLRRAALRLRRALAGAPDVRGMRIAALAAEQFPPDIDARRVARARDARSRCCASSARPSRRCAVPFDFDALMRAQRPLIAAEAYAVHRAYIEDPALPIDPVGALRACWRQGDQRRRLHRRARRAAPRSPRLRRWMRGRDALLTPTLPITATPLDEVDEATTPLAPFTRAANYLGALRAVAAGRILGRRPADRRAAVGAAFADATLMRIGRAFQRATDWHLRRPDLSAWEEPARRVHVARVDGHPPG